MVLVCFKQLIAVLLDLNNILHMFYKFEFLTKLKILYNPVIKLTINEQIFS